MKNGVSKGVRGAKKCEGVWGSVERAEENSEKFQKGGSTIFTFFKRIFFSRTNLKLIEKQQRL